MVNASLCDVNGRNIIGSFSDVRPVTNSMRPLFLASAGYLTGSATWIVIDGFKLSDGV